MMTEERKNRIKNRHRISFTVTNYSSMKTEYTGWLIEYIGNGFWRVWSDTHKRYIAVYYRQMGWKIPRA